MLCYATKTPFRPFVKPGKGRCDTSHYVRQCTKYLSISSYRSGDICYKKFPLCITQKLRGCIINTKCTSEEMERRRHDTRSCKSNLLSILTFLPIEA